MMNSDNRIIKKMILLLTLVTIIVNKSFAQMERSDNANIIKLDVYNLVGLGVQKVHIGYEFTPFPANSISLPTVQCDLFMPFSSWDGTIGFKPSVEAGVQLRFYQGANLQRNNPSGFYLGVAIDGGVTQFRRTEKFTSFFYDDIEQKIDYNRLRTGMYGMIGAQSNISKKIYFDISVGLGWSNLTVKANQSDPAGFLYYQEDFLDPMYLSYNRGKYHSIYIPLNASIGYRIK